MNNDNNKELIWGEIKVKDLLKKLYPIFEGKKLNYNSALLKYTDNGYISISMKTMLICYCYFLTFPSRSP